MAVSPAFLRTAANPANNRDPRPVDPNITVGANLNPAVTSQGDFVNYKPNTPAPTGETTLGQGPAIPTVADIIARNMPSQPSASTPGVTVAGSPGPESDLSTRWGSTPLGRMGLKEQAFAEKQHVDAANELLKQHQDARAQSESTLKLALELARYQNEIRQNVDTADFAHHSQGLDPTHPDYDKHVSQLLTTFPHADKDIVKQILEPFHDTRKRYNDELAKGGAEEFSGAALNRFQDVMQNKGNLFQAKAEARKVAKGEEDLLKGKAAGHITDKDLMPDIENANAADSGYGWMKSNLWEKDSKGQHTGYLDYNKVRSLIATRAGAQSGVTNDKSIVSKYAGKALEDIDDPTERTIVQSARDRVAEYERSHGGGAPNPVRPRTAADYTSGL